MKYTLSILSYVLVEMNHPLDYEETRKIEA